MDPQHTGTFEATQGRFSRGPSPDPVELTVARALVTAPGAHLAFDDGDGLRAVPIDRDILRIGRGLSSEICFDDATVSRRHALLTRDQDGVHLLDDRSLNGVFVNGERISSRTLCDGDAIAIGRHVLRFVVGAPVPV